jgi:hypothetical protein
MAPTSRRRACTLLLIWLPVDGSADVDETTLFAELLGESRSVIQKL